jgi:Tfp pilus assembly protein FimT
MMRIERRRERGFSAIEIMIVLTVSMVLMTFALVGVDQARERVRLQDGARALTNQLEKARTDSIRRHADAASQAGVQILNASTYRVAFDQNSDGVLAAGETLDVALPTGVTFVINPAPSAASYDWRGRVATPITYTLQNSTGTTTVNITGAGDVSLNSTAVVPATASTPFLTPTPTPTPSPTPTPTTGDINGCSIAPSPTALTVRKSGKTAGTVYEGGSLYGQPSTVTVTFDTSNLSLKFASGGVIKNGDTFQVYPTGTVAISVNDLKNSNSNYTSTITFDSDCGPYDVIVTVTQ